MHIWSLIKEPKKKKGLKSCHNFYVQYNKLYQLSSRNSQLKRPKAIIAQHTFGIPADMYKIVEIAKKYNLYIIEDSCHAIGSKYKGKEVGTFGDAAFFSSQW